jgi:serine/threonine-protein kinase
MHVEEKPVPPRKRRPELSRRFERVIVRCLAKHPDDRYASAEAMSEDLDQLTSGERDTTSFGVAPATTGEMQPVKPGAGRGRRLLLAFGAIALIVMVAALVVVLGR